MKYKLFGCLWAASTLSMAICGDAISVEALMLLALCSVVSGLAAVYQYDRYVQSKAQHELNMKLRRARR